jgi:spermidine synthase
MNKILTLVSFLLIGCYATVVQVLFIREFMVVFFGSELCLGIILAGWLSGIALGAAGSVHLIKRFSGIFSLFIILQIAVCLTPFFQIYGIRIIRALLCIPPGEYSNLLILTSSTFLVILPFSLLIGLLFPCACTLLGSKAHNKAQQIGWVYILEAIGSLVGGVLVTFFMLPHLRAYEILSILALLVLFNCFLLSLSGDALRRFPAAACCGVLLPLFLYLLLSGRVAALDRYSIEKRWDAYKNNLEMLVSVDSRYQNIVVARDEDQYSIFGNGQYLTSFPDPYQTAVFTHLNLSQHPHPRTILLVGGGATGIIQEILKYPVRLVHYVELDPVVLEATLPFLSPDDTAALQDERVTVFHTDGRHYIKRVKTSYDMVILNLPDPSTAMLNRFYTREFFQEVKSILSEGGVMITGISAPVDYMGGEAGVYASSLYHTLKKVFPYIVIVPGTKNYFIAGTTPHTVTADSSVLTERYLSYSIESDYFTPYLFATFLPEDRVAFIKASLENHPSPRINTDIHPITYFYNLVLWVMVAGERGEGTFLQGFTNSVNGLFLALALFFLIRVTYVLFTQERVSHHLTFNGLLTIATTGFAGMALEIVLLFAFQNIYGYVYHKVGLIIALFMLGLSLGGYLMNRLLAGRERNWISILITCEVLICIYACFLPYALVQFSLLERAALPASSNLEYIFMLLVVGAGFLTGLEFPLVSRILIKDGEIGKVAGWVDGFDHLGACFGALLTGTVLVPLLGFYRSCFFTGVLNLASGLLLVLYLIQRRRGARSV